MTGWLCPGDGRLRILSDLQGSNTVEEEQL